MDWWKQLGLRWKVPLAVLAVQGLVVWALWFFLSDSRSDLVKLAFVLVAYPFLGPYTWGILWFCLLFALGWFLEKRDRRRS